MDTFKKLSTNILTSSVWDEDSDTKVVWVTLLALSDRHGVVGLRPAALARQAGVPLDKAQCALDKFLAPDANSRNKDYDGRRLEVVDGGYRLLNHTRYHEARDTEARREYFKEQKRKSTMAKKAKAENATQPPPASTEYVSDMDFLNYDVNGERCEAVEGDSGPRKPVTRYVPSRHGYAPSESFEREPSIETFDDITGSNPRYGWYENE